MSSTRSTSTTRDAERPVDVERHGAVASLAGEHVTDGPSADASEVSADGPADVPAPGVAGRLRRVAGDAGMATAEYAIATLAAVGFAGLLVVILKGNEVKSLLTGIVRQALGG